MGPRTAGDGYLVESGVSDVVDASDHRGADVVFVAAFEVAVEVDALAQSIHRVLLRNRVAHGEIGLQRGQQTGRWITRIPNSTTVNL